MNASSRLFVAGGDTLLGAAVLRQCGARGYTNLVGVGEREPDLRCATATEAFFRETRPEVVVVAAGVSAGIGHNRRFPADMMLDNLLVTANVLRYAAEYGVRRLMYLGSSCMYPVGASQPMRVEDLWTGPVEDTSAAYATAKLAGVRLCEAYRRQEGRDFRVGIPANAFGPGDDFREEAGHVVPALMRRMHDAIPFRHRPDRKGGRGSPVDGASRLPATPDAEASPSATHALADARACDGQERPVDIVSVWGTGTPRREFAYADDLADAVLFALALADAPPIMNLGTGEDRSIAEAARAIARVVGYRGDIAFDDTKPDGAPLKMLDSSPLRSLGWKPTTDFEQGLLRTYTWFLQHEVTEDRTHATPPLPRPVPHPTRRGGDRPRVPLR